MLDGVFDNFLLRALIGGLGVAIVAGPFGCFVVWRRMAYFGDTLAHSSLLGVALGLLLDLNVNLGIIAVCVAVALLLVFAPRQKSGLASDTLLGILSHSALALGLVLSSFLENVRIDLMAYLFGDILAIGTDELYWIYGGGILALALLAALWRPLLAMTVHEELARVEGAPIGIARLGFVLVIALVVAVCLKIVGILLVTALLIIPAAAARRFARTPEGMAVMAALIGALAVGGGLGGSYLLDTPSGPSVVLAAALLFVITRGLGALALTGRR